MKREAIKNIEIKKNVELKAFVNSVSTNCCGNVVGYLTIRNVKGSFDGQRLPVRTKEGSKSN
jgi:hypothetical protein